MSCPAAEGPSSALSRLRISTVSVSSTVGFVKGGSGMDIEVRPGKAVEWTEKTYPFNQDTSAVGGIEPLILPWTGTKSRYRWNGSAFAK